ncbi:hypothetical protein RHGRI_003001 [Rhododendron griersonianum]|uniref:Uncharacterized protein n=1 Tax=Rhododendron griersonianum TaxID=479676 RepID=A0AAV6LSE1_9ERIC|nr:hypothetical protein RHGRI_003001 [Rhododendron griersonianum]
MEDDGYRWLSSQHAQEVNIALAFSAGIVEVMAGIQILEWAASLLKPVVLDFLSQCSKLLYVKAARALAKAALCNVT